VDILVLDCASSDGGIFGRVAMSADKYNMEQLPSGFRLFWRGYPKKVAKYAAYKAWVDLGLEEQAGMINARSRDYPWSDDRQYIPHASTWLNGRRYHDTFDEDENDDWT
jgi:hypothetical protein